MRYTKDSDERVSARPLAQLLWEPLPTALPASGQPRFVRVRDLAAEIIADATPVPKQEQVDRCVRRGAIQAPTFEFAIVSDGESLGDVTYGICQACRTALLYKIEFAPDWQFCGFGRLALSQLEDRHSSLTWHTAGRAQHARGFYDRYRQDSSSPWTARQHPCSHFD